MDSKQQEVLTVEEVAHYLKVPRSTVYGLASRRQIPSHKVGRHWRFLKPAIDRWLDERMMGSLDQTPAAGVLHGLADHSDCR